jgi:hypothetical protein
MKSKDHFSLHSPERKVIKLPRTTLEFPFLSLLTIYVPDLAIVGLGQTDTN